MLILYLSQSNKQLGGFVSAGLFAPAFSCLEGSLFYLYHCFKAHLIGDMGADAQSSSAGYIAKVVDSVSISIPQDRVLVENR